MSLSALLAARAHGVGRAQSTALFRHRGLAAEPLCIVAWQLGAEPYTVGAIALGTQSSGYDLFVPGYPINRDLLFAALTPFARKFCTAFEAYAQGPCELVHHRGGDLPIPHDLPQIIVANTETIGLLGRLGRRLAYLDTTGEQAADPVLPRMGRHLMWLAEHAHLPGQQLILPMSELLRSHYATAMSSYETASLAALDAWIKPGKGEHGFDAAEKAERKAVGPVPDPADAVQVYDKMMAFNKARDGRKDPASVRKLVKPLRGLYDNMVNDTWALIWRTLDRERKRLEALHVARRVRSDRIAYASHMQWMAGSSEGRLKARLDARSAAVRLNDYERADALLRAEEAVDDPLRMVPILLAGQAMAGDVVRAEPDRREVINGRSCKRPSVAVRTDEPCMLLPGTDVWWTQMPAGREWLIVEVTPSGSGSEVRLVLQTNRQLAVPCVGDRACFSLLNLQEGYGVHLPWQVPWTHQPPSPTTETDLDGSEAA
jgi:hypothetical protein